jgi:hypothetical protein
MRTSVDEVSRGIGRWCAKLLDKYGNVVEHAFSDRSADDAEDLLIGKIAGMASDLRTLQGYVDEVLANMHLQLVAVLKHPDMCREAVDWYRKQIETLKEHRSTTPGTRPGVCPR